MAKVNVIHVNELTEDISESSYFFPSFKSEYIINDTLDFYTRHMLKIAERLEYFHANGSNFQIKYIESIHILLTSSFTLCESLCTKSKTVTSSLKQIRKLISKKTSLKSKKKILRTLHNV